MATTTRQQSRHSLRDAVSSFAVALATGTISEEEEEEEGEETFSTDTHSALAQVRSVQQQSVTKCSSGCTAGPHHVYNAFSLVSANSAGTITPLTGPSAWRNGCTTATAAPPHPPPACFTYRNSAVHHSCQCGVAALGRCSDGCFVFRFVADARFLQRVCGVSRLIL